MYVRRGEGPPQRPAVSNIAGDPLAIGDEYLSDFQDDEVEIYTDYRQMLAQAPIDAVNDFTTHALHHQIAAAAFAHGKHLLSQKPLAVTIAAGRRMCQEAESRDLIFGVFENFRHSPQTRQLKGCLRGRPLRATANDSAGLYRHLVGAEPGRGRNSLAACPARSRRRESRPGRAFLRSDPLCGWRNRQRLSRNGRTGTAAIFARRRRPAEAGNCLRRGRYVLRQHPHGSRRSWHPLGQLGRSWHANLDRPGHGLLRQPRARSPETK